MKVTCGFMQQKKNSEVACIYVPPDKSLHSTVVNRALNPFKGTVKEK